MQNRKIKFLVNRIHFKRKKGIFKKIVEYATKMMNFRFKKSILNQKCTN